MVSNIIWLSKSEWGIDMNPLIVEVAGLLGLALLSLLLVMPDHMPHYYRIHYDENGVVDSVEDTLPLGG